MNPWVLITTVFSLFFCYTNSFGLAVPAKWVLEKNKAYLIINPSPYLSKDQKDIIFSGLPAYSSVTLLNGEERSPVKVKSCAVKFDLWDEHFSVLYAEEVKKKHINIQEYFEACVRFKFADGPQVRTLIKPKNELNIKLSFTQISGQTTLEIKNWLVGQQSSVLKGLFSHMLGELKLEETNTLDIVKPSKAPILEKR